MNALPRGKFITFEGGEGGGKSTQAAALARRLEALGLEVCTTREPGGSAGAEIMRHVILSGVAKPLGPEAEAIFFAAARDDHVRSRIAPALARGAWVICDRFSDSTRVYQGAAGRVDRRLLAALERVTVGPLKPDLTLILDLPVDVGLARAKQRRGKDAMDRFEAEGREFHDKLRAAFRALADAEPERCAVIDADRDIADVAASIWSVVQTRLHPRPTMAATAAAR